MRNLAKFNSTQYIGPGMFRKRVVRPSERAGFLERGKSYCYGRSEPLAVSA